MGAAECSGKFGRGMDEVASRPSETVARRVRPHDLGWLKRTGVYEAELLAYDEVVDLVARARRITAEKAKFAAREVL